MPLAMNLGITRFSPLLKSAKSISNVIRPEYGFKSPKMDGCFGLLIGSAVLFMYFSQSGALAFELADYNSKRDAWQRYTPLADAATEKLCFVG